MRPDQGSIFAGTIMSETAQTRLRHILEKSAAPQPSDTDNFKKLKAVYDACLNEPEISKRGSEPLDKMLAHLEKIYPAKSGRSSDTQGQLTSAIVYLMESGVAALVSPSVNVSQVLLPISAGLGCSDLSSPMTAILIMWQSS